jgi:O-antigen/teichoic acid export membrane protein
MLVVMAKLGSPQMVGRFTLGLAITAPVMLFASLKTRIVQATDARQEYSFGHYLGLRLITTVLALLVIAGIVFVSGYRRETAWVILAVGLAKAFESLSDVFYGLLQQHERMDRIAKSMMIKGPASLFALGAGIYLTGSVLWGGVGLVVAWALVLASYDVRSAALLLRRVSRDVDPGRTALRQKPTLHPLWEWRTLSGLAWRMLPLGIVLALTSLRTNIPRYFVERYLGEYELGIFAAMSYLMVVGNTVATALGHAASPRLARYYAAGNGPAFRTLLLKLVGVGGLLGGAGVLVALVAGRQLLTLLYRPEYAAQHTVLVRLMVAAGIDFVATFLYFGMMAARYFKVQVPLFAVVTGSAALLCLWLIPADGLRGAATVLVIATVVRVGGSLVILVDMLRGLQRPRQGVQIRQQGA